MKKTITFVFIVLLLSVNSYAVKIVGSESGLKVVDLYGYEDKGWFLDNHDINENIDYYSTRFFSGTCNLLVLPGESFAYANSYSSDREEYIKLEVIFDDLIIVSLNTKFIVRNSNYFPEPYRINLKLNQKVFVGHSLLKHRGAKVIEIKLLQIKEGEAYISVRTVK